MSLESLPTTWQISNQDQGQRLDRWLANHLPQFSRSYLQKLIEQGQVLLNQQICTQKNYVLQAGHFLSIQIPPVQAVDIRPQAMALDILYEDEHLLVINKPKGLVVHPAAGHAHDTLVNALMAHCDYLSGINGEQRPGIVHRLDKDTSGVMVVAKTDPVHRHLQGQIQAKTAQREYLGIVFGHPPQASGEIVTAISRHPQDRKKMAVVEAGQGRQAITLWRVLERLGNYTLMHFRLATGRTHQIRVHAAYLRCPIVGDPVYTASKTSPVKLSGQALHAWRLTFSHPVSQETITCQAPLPDEMERLLRQLRQS
ncbi:MAG: RluA family pseudouridine synthase [Cyanobacteriota bacterium]|nr:RluA family pseudouridine synthase [Cyanobacteriota bacterium]